MFSRKDQLLRKTGPDGIGRFDFLRLLKKEFEETIQEDSKNQTLANLANFAYDPINYEYMRSLNLLDLFLEQFRSGNEELIHFSSAAICNLSADPTNRDLIIRKNGIKLVAKLLYSKDEEVVLNSLQQELDRPFIKGPIGIRQCTNKCLETIVKHLPNSPAIICATMDRDCFKEKAYLFIKNGNSLWHNTKLSAGREYCCKDNIHYKCPL
ncbi:Follicle cell protein 3C [Carabus blaptoides fortunei]